MNDSFSWEALTESQVRSQYRMFRVLILLWMFWPFLVNIPTGIFATVNGCQVDEGVVHPCVVLGYDWGSILSDFCILGWFLLLTIPSGLLGLLVLPVAKRRDIRKAQQHDLEELKHAQDRDGVDMSDE